MPDQLAEPPKSLLLVHGAANGPWVFDGWPPSFRGPSVQAVDLHEGLDVARATMAAYAAAVERSAAGLPRPLALVGWSMGGLVALMAAASLKPSRLILLEPSPPAEIQGFDPELEPEPGVFDGEEVYGDFPPGVRSRPESVLARGERKCGISVPSLRCPSLAVFGDEFEQDRGRAIAALYGSDALHFAGMNHWDLVLDPRVPASVAAWLS